jgi:lipid-binding SYLF domain-containing protein
VTKARGLRNAAVLIMFSLVARTLLADNTQTINTDVYTSLQTFYAQNPKHRDLANQAAGMLVFPRVVKGGIGVAAEYGQGVLIVNGTTVKYYSIGGASVGLTAGMDQRSEIILFMTQNALDKFKRSKGWTVGLDAGVALMAEGDGGLYDSKTLRKPIIGFVYGETGLMGDISMEGSKINALKR